MRDIVVYWSVDCDDVGNCKQNNESQGGAREVKSTMLVLFDHEFVLVVIRIGIVSFTGQTPILRIIAQFRHVNLFW